jgi:hypothetical protein
MSHYILVVNDLAQRHTQDEIQALFDTRVLVGISGDNSLEYWVKPLPSPNPHKTLPIIH